MGCTVQRADSNEVVKAIRRAKAVPLVLDSRVRTICEMSRSPTLACLRESRNSPLGGVSKAFDRSGQKQCACKFVSWASEQMICFAKITSVQPLPYGSHLACWNERLSMVSESYQEDG